jgi:hypothetical protein
MLAALRLELVHITARKGRLKELFVELSGIE